MILSRAEDDIVTYRVRVGTQSAGRRGGHRVAVHPDVPKGVPQSSLHGRRDILAQKLARCVKRPANGLSACLAVRALAWAVAADAERNTHLALPLE